MKYKITIIIPTYKRHDYVLRQMSLLSSCPVLVHVLDGSDVGLDAIQLASKPENVIYHHLPIPVDARFKFALDLIKTPYAALLSDDDIFLPKGLNACVDFLDKNPEFVSCVGRCMGFKVEHNKLKAHLVYPYMHHRILDEEDVIKRIKKHLNPYSPSTVFSVMRASAWKNSIRAMSENVYSSVYSAEVMFEVMTSVQGKSQVLPILMWLRSFENEPVDNNEWSRKLSFYDWYKDKKYVKEVEEYNHNLALELTRIHGWKDSDAAKGASDCFNEYIRYCDIPRNDILFSKIIKKLGLKENRLRNFEDALDFMIHDGCKVNFSELEEILNTVKEFHQMTSSSSAGPT